jgi:hypothetical protein
MRYATVNDLYGALSKHLAARGYSKTYANEAAFEADVWDRVIAFMADVVKDTGTLCLTSHTAKHRGRSDAAWELFRREARGPDVKVLDSNNRLDIVVKHPVEGSIGIEVKCLGHSGHTGKLTQGIGQTMLGLAHRDRTLLMIHCGTVETKDRDQLQAVAHEITRGTRMSILVVP